MYHVALSFGTYNPIGFPIVNMLVTDAATGAFITGLTPQQFSVYYWQTSGNQYLLTQVPDVGALEVEQVNLPGVYELISQAGLNLATQRSYPVAVTIASPPPQIRPKSYTPTILGSGIGTYVCQP